MTRTRKTKLKRVMLCIGTAVTLWAGVQAAEFTAEADPPEAGVVSALEQDGTGTRNVLLQALAMPGFLFLYWSDGTAATYDNFMLPEATAMAASGTAFTAHFMPYDGLCDTDGDSIPDAWEDAWGEPVTSTDNAADDEDNDDLTVLQEHRYLCNPEKRDTDGDTLPDGWEVAVGLNPRDASDADGDLDGDGIRNRNEYVSRDILDKSKLYPGWNIVSVWREGPVTLDPSQDSPVVYRWDARRQRFVEAADLSHVSPGEALLVYREDPGVFLSSVWGVTCASVTMATGSALVWVPIPVYYLTVRAFPSYAGEVSQSSTMFYPSNPVPIEVTATPERFYLFLMWTGTEHASIEDPFSSGTFVSLTGNSTVTANFREHEGVRDIDHDLMLDIWETAYALNPLDPEDASGDLDLDGLNNLGEHRAGTRPDDPDTDGDGITDGKEVDARLDPLDPLDAGLDQDGDGLSNLEEARLGRPIDGKLLPTGWNLISTARPVALQFTVPRARLLAFDTETQRCVEHPPEKVLNPAKGYWVFSPSLAEFDIWTGEVVELTDELVRTAAEDALRGKRSRKSGATRRITVKRRMTRTAERSLSDQ